MPSYVTGLGVDCLGRNGPRAAAGSSCLSKRRGLRAGPRPWLASEAVPGACGRKLGVAVARSSLLLGEAVCCCCQTPAIYAGCRRCPVFRGGQAPLLISVLARVTCGSWSRPFPTVQGGSGRAHHACLVRGRITAWLGWSGVQTEAVVIRCGPWVASVGQVFELAGEQLDGFSPWPPSGPALGGGVKSKRWRMAALAPALPRACLCSSPADDGRALR